mmetsp:Transcript_12421/g.29351  ORF Transcript_12421/g.29351 Transcript_12421/m.29351 type:complete len:264 (+) Transcript_12421:743-1534(+)
MLEQARQRVGRQEVLPLIAGLDPLGRLLGILATTTLAPALLPPLGRWGLIHPLNLGEPDLAQWTRVLSFGPSLDAREAENMPAVVEPGLLVAGGWFEADGAVLLGRFLLLIIPFDIVIIVLGGPLLSCLLPGRGEVILALQSGRFQAAGSASRSGGWFSTACGRRRRSIIMTPSPPGHVDVGQVDDFHDRALVAACVGWFGPGGGTAGSSRSRTRPSRGRRQNPNAERLDFLHLPFGPSRGTDGPADILQGRHVIGIVAAVVM